MMRIFCAIRHSVDPKQYYGGLWSANFYPALLGLGHEIVESQTDLTRTSRFMDIPSDFTGEELAERAQATDRILTEVRSAHLQAPIDLFLSYFYNAHFDPEAFGELRRLAIPSVNFYCNSIYQFDLVKAIAAKADFAWHAEKEARTAYLKVGANPVWLQMAADPKMYSPVPAAKRARKACFVGQRYADRDRWMAGLLRAGIPVEIYGAGWTTTADGLRNQMPNGFGVFYLGRRRTVPGSWPSLAAVARQNINQMGIAGGIARIAKQWQYRTESRKLTPLFASSAYDAIEPREIPTIFAKYEVCLNFSNVWSDGRPGSPLIPHVRLRDFEAPMCRTCYLTGHTDEIGEFYDIGREIDTYHSGEELADKVRFYLLHPEAAEKLRESGYRRAIQKHTWRSRFEELFRKIGLARVC